MIPGKLLAIKTQINRHLIQFALTCAVVPLNKNSNNTNKKTIMQKCCVQWRKKRSFFFLYTMLACSNEIFHFT